MKNYIQIHPSDNVLVALKDLKQNSEIDFKDQKIILTNDVPAKHKFTINSLGIDEEVIMYGIVVGKATQAIQAGEVITTFNLKHKVEEYSLQKRKALNWTKPNIANWKNKTFLGYPRENGSFGTRNFWLVIPLVFCENRNIMVMKDAFERELGFAQPDIYRSQVQNLVSAFKNSLDIETFSESDFLQQETEKTKIIFSNLDGIKFLTHEMGCGGTENDSMTLAKVFAGFAVNPNVAGVTVLSLGCQKTQLSDLEREIKMRCPEYNRPILYFNQQDFYSVQSLIQAAIHETFVGLTQINTQKRIEVPINKLNIGLKCGGSDGFSGISANPVLGKVSDWMVALGGSTILAEFPELCGVEQELINRAESTEIAEKFVKLYSEYADLAATQGAAFDMNPSVGNIKDGLITDAIKSAGAAKKGGDAPISDVLDYTEICKKSGLSLLCTPGNDVLATTAMAASGTNIILFTTGLGTPTGNPICPVIKISTNSILFNKMNDILDFDCGRIIEAKENIEENASKLLNYIIEVASGKIITKAEKLGQDDFIPWRRNINL